jgi:hypothetical protein
MEMSPGANRYFLGRRSFSLANYYLLGPPAVHPSKQSYILKKMKVKKVQQVLSKDNFIWKGGKVNGYSEEG